MSIMKTLSNLWEQTAFMNLEWGNYVMILVALVFLYLAIKHGFEPLLLVPIAFGMLLVNIYPDIMADPYVDAMGIEHAGGLLHYFFILDEWSILPSLIFMGVGAMTDFGPLIANPKSFILGAAVPPKPLSAPLFHRFHRQPNKIPDIPSPSGYHRHRKNPAHSQSYFLRRVSPFLPGYHRSTLFLKSVAVIRI